MACRPREAHRLPRSRRLGSPPHGSQQGSSSRSPVTAYPRRSYQVTARYQCAVRRHTKRSAEKTFNLHSPESFRMVNYHYEPHTSASENVRRDFDGDVPCLSCLCTRNESLQCNAESPRQTRCRTCAARGDQARQSQSRRRSTRVQSQQLRWQKSNRVVITSRQAGGVGLWELHMSTLRGKFKGNGWTSPLSVDTQSY